MWLARLASKLSRRLARKQRSRVVFLAAITLFSYCFLCNMMNVIELEVVKSSMPKEEEKQPPFRFFNSSKVFNESYTPYLAELGLIGEREDFVDLSKPLPTVTFIAAISENHVAEGRALIIRLAKDHPDWKIYIYDIGMKNTSRVFFEKACNVGGVRHVDLVHFGVDGNLFTYRWKPIAIAQALQEFPVVFYIDTSTFFSKHATVGDFVNRISITDNQGPHAYLVDQTTHSTYAATNPGIFDWLAPQGDLYPKQHQSGKMIYVRTKATMDLAMKWFVLCALESACMAPPKAKLDCGSWHTDNIYTYKNCHRYDQSAINLILLPYPKSLLAPWTGDYTWTLRNVDAEEKEIICQ